MDAKVNIYLLTGSHVISQTAEYALRAIVSMANRRGEVINRNDLAKAIQVPNEYLSKVLKELDLAGIVHSQRGPGGGYILTKSTAELSLYDVIAVISPIKRIESCPLGLSNHTHLCPLHKRLDEATELMEKALRETTIAELIEGKRDRNDCRFPNIAKLSQL